MADLRTRLCTGERSRPGIEPNKFKTFTGRPAAPIFCMANSQFTACSGKIPVCLKPMVLSWKVNSP